MTVPSKTIEYEVQQNPRGHRWTAVSYPVSEQDAVSIYQEHAKDYPDIKFRIIKIEVTKTVVKE